MKPVIVLDPGHGGHDPGVVHKGRRESDAALEMALTCKFALAMAGWDVRLTRDGSEVVKPDLMKRVKFAESVNARAFVSIHYNSVDAGPLVYFAPGWASLKLARVLAGVLRLKPERVWESARSRFGGLYVDAFDDERPAILWEVASINNAPASGVRGKWTRLTLARKLVKAVEYLK